MVDATKYPTRIAPYGLRMPPELKDRIDAAARANSRSMNAEIVAALEHAFPAPDALGNAISQLGSLNMMKAQAATEDARAAYDLAIKAAVDELARLVHG